MKVLLVHQYFKTPDVGGAIRSYYLAKGLAEAGHEITVVTSHNNSSYLYQNLEGIKVHFLPVYYDNALSFTKRKIAFVKFVYKAIKLVKQLERQDLAYCISTPLSIGYFAMWYKRNYKVPYYFEVGDLWPEAPIQLGVVRNFFVKGILNRWEKSIYHHADKIISLSPSIAESIKQKSPKSDIYTVPNMADTEFFNAEEKDPHLERQYRLNGKFVIGYFGSVGFANNLEYLVNFANACQQKGYHQLAFIVVGSGAFLNKTKNSCKKKALTNIIFLDPGNKGYVKQLMTLVDAVYISFKKKPILETGSPNKFFDGLAAGKLIIVNFKGWIYDLIKNNRCGIYLDPEKPNAFMDELAPYLEDTKLLAKAQMASRQLAEHRFSRKELVANLIAIINNETHEVQEPINVN